MRDDDNVIVNVVSEVDGILAIESPGGTRESYHLNPIRTMRLIVWELQVMCGSISQAFGMPERLPPPQLRVQGEAWLDQGQISVVGEPTNKSRAFNITFRAYDETDLAVREEKLGKLPPTVHLGFNRSDWEIGDDDSWFIECYVSQQMLDSIVAAVTAGTMREMNLGLTLENIYIDHDWAPPSMSVDWFLRPSRSDNSLKIPEMARGWVSVLNMGLAKIDMRAPSIPEPEAQEEDFEETPVAPPDLQLLALTTLANNVEKLRGTVKIAGWAIAIVLLVLALQ